MALTLRLSCGSAAHRATRGSSRAGDGRRRCHTLARASERGPSSGREVREAFSLLAPATSVPASEPVRDAIDFAERVVELLEEGAFTATHKYAAHVGLLD